jgi:hypothetical protein
MSAKSLSALISALNIEGQNNVNKPSAKTSFKNKAMESVCSMLQAITIHHRSAPQFSILLRLRILNA